jgi:hypothetical protein
MESKRRGIPVFHDFHNWLAGFFGNNKSRSGRQGTGRKSRLFVEDLEKRDLLAFAGQEPLFLEPIPFQSMTRNEDILTVPLQVSGGNGATPSFSASLQSSAALAFQLDSRFGFNVPTNYRLNLHGLQEKNFKGKGNLSFYLTPQGELFRWGGSVERSTFLTLFDPSYYNEPAKLCKAPFASDQAIAYQFQGNEMILDPPPGFLGSLAVTVYANDGETQTEQDFQVFVGNKAPVIAQLSNQVLQGGAPVTLTVPASDVDGDPLAYSYSIQAPTGKMLGLHYQGPQVTLDPATSDAGIYQVIVTVKDGLTESVGAFQVTVNKTAGQDVSFIPNRGQTDKQALYVAQTTGYSSFLTKQGIVLGLNLPGSTPGDAGTYVGQRIQFVGARAAAKLTPGQLLPGQANYFQGAAGSKWLNGISTYGEVLAKGVYAGIDVRYHDADGKLQYDFIVAPKANPSKITLAFPDAANVGLDGEGKLVVTLPGGAGQLIQGAPVLYQQNGTQVDLIPGRYVLKGNNRVGFQVDSYDPKLPLVIDPYVFSSFVGGGNADTGEDIAIDAAGNLYVAGTTNTSAFPTFNAMQPSNAGSNDMVVVKLNPNGFGGYTPVYSTFVGGGGNDQSAGIAVDSFGNAYVVGTTTSGPIGTGAFPIVGSTMDNNVAGDFIPVFKLSPSGALLYSAIPNTTGVDRANGIAVNPAGTRIYLTGSTDRNNNYMTPTAGAFQSVLGASRDGFLMVIDPAVPGPTEKNYFSFLGGNGNDYGSALALDAAGMVYLAGGTNSNTLPVTGAGGQMASAGNWDGFVAKINPQNTGPSDLVYATYLGGNLNDWANGIAVNASGTNVYLTGRADANFPMVGSPFQGTFQGPPAGRDAFVAKLTFSSAAIATWTNTTYIGGTNAEQGNAIALDGLGNVYVVGETDSPDLPLFTQDQVYQGGSDAFVTVLDANLSTTLFSTYLGGSNSDFGNAIVVGSTGDIIAAGSTRSSALFPTVNGLGFPFSGFSYGGGGSDIFITQFQAVVSPPPPPGPPGPPPPPPPPPGPPSPPPPAVAAAADRFEYNDSSLRPTKFGSLGAGSSTNRTDLSISRKARGLPDNDWFRWNVSQGGTVTVTLDNVQAGSGDMHVQIYKLANGVLHQIGASRQVGGSLTQVVTANVAAGTNLMVWVYGYNFSRGIYDLTVSLT